MNRDHLLSECGGCGSEDPLLLFNAGPRSSGIYRRLCPACLLKSHQGSFCPFCFDHVDDSPSLPSLSSAICCSCNALAHASCLPSDAVPPPLFRCPPCSNPNFLYFPIYRKNPKPRAGNPDPSSQSPYNGRVLDKDSAKALLAAVRISATSMAKAANVARVEAEKRAKESVFAKKRAREALDRVAYPTDTNPSNKDSKGVIPAESASPLPRQKKMPPHNVDAAFPVHRRIPRNPAVSPSLPAASNAPLPPKSFVSTEIKSVQNRDVPEDKNCKGLNSVSPCDQASATDAKQSLIQDVRPPSLRVPF